MVKLKYLHILIVFFKKACVIVISKKTADIIINAFNFLGKPKYLW